MDLCKKQLYCNIYDWKNSNLPLLSNSGMVLWRNMYSSSLLSSAKWVKDMVERIFSSALISSSIPTGKRSSCLCFLWEYLALFLVFIWSLWGCDSSDCGIRLRLLWDIFLLLKYSCWFICVFFYVCCLMRDFFIVWWWVFWDGDVKLKYTCLLV